MLTIVFNCPRIDIVGTTVEPNVPDGISKMFVFHFIFFIFLFFIYFVMGFQFSFYFFGIFFPFFCYRLSIYPYIFIFLVNLDLILWLLSSIFVSFFLNFIY
jgi:hypothetical protein